MVKDKTKKWQTVIDQINMKAMIVDLLRRVWHPTYAMSLLSEWVYWVLLIFWNSGSGYLFWLDPFGLLSIMHILTHVICFIWAHYGCMKDTHVIELWNLMILDAYHKHTSDMPSSFDPVNKVLRYECLS